jgi:antitoxin ParD1/3/4
MEENISMAIVNISLPDQMKQYIEERLSEGGYNTTSEYFRDLIREDQKRRVQERLETLMLRGLESPASEWTKDDVDHIKNAVRERLAEKQKDA